MQPGRRLKEAVVETTRECVVIRPEKGIAGKQGLEYLPGISAETAGARRLCLQSTTMPPAGRTRAHLHEDHESAIYVVEGEVVLWYGPNLEQRLEGKAGDFFYVPPGVPHVALNASDSEPVEAVIARTDPNDQERVVLLPELDELPRLARRP